MHWIWTQRNTNIAADITCDFSNLNGVFARVLYSLATFPPKIFFNFATYSANFMCRRSSRLLMLFLVLSVALEYRLQNSHREYS